MNTEFSLKDCFCREAVFGSDAYKKAIHLRDIILRQPLNLQFTKEELALENDSHHLVCYYHSEIIGVIVLRPINNSTLKMRQVAIAEAYQRKGIGQFMVDYCEQFAKSKGVSKIELHARDTAIPFYVKLAYHTVGDEFVEVGIKHYKMIKQL